MRGDEAGGRSAPTWALYFARADWRTRWRSHLLLAGTTAMTVAVVVAALTGAGRSESAFRRLRTETRASDALAIAPPDELDAQLRTLAATPGVLAAEVGVELFARPVGSEYFPDYDLFATAPLQAGGNIDAPVIKTGRAADPARADEVVLSERMARDIGSAVGDEITLESATPTWVQLAFNGGDPGPLDGPRIPVHVVGLSRSPADFGRYKAIAFLTPAFVERYGSQMNAYHSVHLQLTPEARAQARDGSLPGLAADEVGPSPFGDDQNTDDGLGAIAIALRLVAAAAALAGAVAVMLTVLRLARVTLRDRMVLAATGWTGGQLVAATVLVFAPWLALGVALGLLGGALGAPLASVGLARAVDPHSRAVVFDRTVLVGVGVSATALLAVVMVIGARRSSSAARERPLAAPRQLPLGRPLPAVLGARQALFGEPDRGGRTSRAAVAVAAIGVVGAVAALVVSASIARLQTDPTLTGQGQNRSVDSGESLAEYDRALPVLDGDDRVARLAGVHISFAVSADGASDLTLLAFDVRRGDLGASMVEGRVPGRPDEVAMGPATLDRLGTHVGDSIDLHGPEGTETYQIVGATLFPEGDFSHDDGLALTVDGADRILGNTHDTAEIHLIAFEWAPGVDAAAADAELVAQGLRVQTNTNALEPPSVANLGEVEALPRYLALFVGALAIVTVAHALVVSVRLRRRELATLRAIGMTPRSTALIVAAQALTVTVVAMVVGLPVGVALGRQVWTPIADGASVVVRPMAPLSWLAIVLAVAVTATLVVAAVPAVRSLRLRPPDALRADD